MENKLWKNKDYNDNYNKIFYNLKKQLDTNLEMFEDINSYSESDYCDSDEIIDIQDINDNGLNIFNEDFYCNENDLIIKNNKVKTKIPIIELEKISQTDESSWENNLEIYKIPFNYIDSVINVLKSLKPIIFKRDNLISKLPLYKNEDSEPSLMSYTTYDSSDNEESFTNSENSSKINSNIKASKTSSKNLLTITPKTQLEIESFRQQEMRRYEDPYSPFEYILDDGVKRIVAPICKKNSSGNGLKPRDHFLLKNDRPPCVTLLSMVRDAASKLPNGIGTRTDICHLIKESQFLIEDINEEKLSTVVSGALDRLHYEKDPCVKYDNEKKLWTYLHLNRDLNDSNWNK